ncbi:hypothetical protein ETAA8_12060 [Anatilimnocola aggregata]|uniref:Uncharacterized protein n=1 Tax=Anatilimnocola aggregata TaxID=2528021 RepID=A0A517Y7L3_9BACT|nr:hypothetical protein [Anatilimnocola aggregata]QDU26132.1 hypothetical protein ETAA8_12060 [Anatilimnocola aggregata]
MLSRPRLIYVFSLAFASLLVAGCEAIPVAQHPLSDEATSQIDEELLGMWDVIAEPEEPKEKAEKPAEPAADEEHPPRFAIGRLAGKELVHEMVALQLNDGGSIDVQRISFYGTRIGEQRLVSMKVDPNSDAADYLILRYTFVNANRVLVHALDRDFITAAIGRGELKGVVKKAATADPNVEPRKQSIRITASAKELHEFLVKHEKKAFQVKAFYRLQRAAGN